MPRRRTGRRLVQGLIGLRAARGDEAAELSALALRSKAWWGYDAGFLAACRAELTWTPAQIDAAGYSVVVATVDGALAGFSAVADHGRGRYELDALFVEPRWIGTGVGRRLMAAARQSIAQAGGGRLRIQGDPHADHFYRAAGAVRIGTQPSGSIPGRALPLFELTIDP
jgi:GNAT superfamily N-acetyltransferase